MSDDTIRSRRDHATQRKRPSGWQDDPLEGAWWLTLLLRIWLWIDRR